MQTHLERSIGHYCIAARFRVFFRDDQESEKMCHSVVIQQNLNAKRLKN
jgi:hypothetical protein